MLNFEAVLASDCPCRFRPTFRRYAFSSLAVLTILQNTRECENPVRAGYRLLCQFPYSASVLGIEHTLGDALTQIQPHMLASHGSIVSTELGELTKAHCHVL